MTTHEIRWTAFWLGAALTALVILVIVTQPLWSPMFGGPNYLREGCHDLAEDNPPYCSAP